MRRRVVWMAILIAAVLTVSATVEPRTARAQGRGQPTDWNRFFYYPYVYYPHNFRRPTGSFNSLYYRYPQVWRIPVYNQHWHNFYPSKRPYHRGNHMILDVF